MEQALPQYEEALRRDPGLVATRLQFGSALRAARQPGRAAEVLREALKQAPDRAAVWYELGLSLIDLDRPEEAAAALERAVATDPDLAEAHNTLGGLWLARGDTARA